MASSSLLAVFAHPDDEAFGTGGTLAYHAAQGTRITLVCATRGEVGEIADPALATPETLGAVRDQELRSAARVLGITDVRFLGYRDSGMAGTPDNRNAHAFMNAPIDVVIEQLVGIMRAVQPQVVITFDPNGGYGHPDHIAIHCHTMAAFHAAGNRHRYPEQGAPWQPERLFYNVVPQSALRAIHETLNAAGIDVNEFHRFEESGIGWPDDQIHAVLDVSRHVEAKWAALNAHRTQFGPDNFFRKLPEDLTRQMLSHEHFAQAWPEPTAGLQLTRLFA